MTAPAVAIHSPGRRSRRRSDGHSSGGRRRMAGQGLTEYLILGSLIGLVLVVGDPSPLESLVRAIQLTYGRYVMALSLP